MEKSQISKRRKKEVTDKAVRDGGFYGNNGVWNSIITFSGDNRLYRERVETIIVKDGKEVFVKKKPNGEYFLPGGSTEKDLPHMDQAVNECKEEAHINIRNIESTGITYKERHETPNWAKRECEVEWNGTYTEVYVAEYDSTFHGHIDKEDQDPFILSGKFYSTKDCFKFFRKEHRDALLWFIKNHQKSEEPITESYISNYFKNKKLLKRISHSPDIEKSAVDQMIDILKKSYYDLSSKSKIQRERKKPDVKELFHPILTFDFSDGKTVSVAICFDDKEITDGAAFHTEGYGDIVVVYPCFFKNKRDDQVFTLLHEFGHIRLHHLELWNSKRTIHGDDKTEVYRQHMMRKGKAMYPEVNADLYAVLNGANMYSILGAMFQKDQDSEYDYRFTNAELSNRYQNVFKKYDRLRGLYAESDIINKYDIACMVIYEMTYLNDNIDYLTETEKDELYCILYEYCINKKIKDDKTVKVMENRYILEKQKSENDCDMKVLQECYIALSEAISDAYNSYCIINDNSQISKGKNKKASIIATEKSVISMEIAETLNDMIYKLHEKKVLMESSDETTISVDHYLYLIESLSSAERAKIPKNEFGIPDTRSYPLDTKKHVESAIMLFGHSDKKYREELAINIFDAMKKYEIPKEKIGKKSQLYQYINLY